MTAVSQQQNTGLQRNLLDANFKSLLVYNQSNNSFCFVIFCSVDKRSPELIDVWSHFSINTGTQHPLFHLNVKHFFNLSTKVLNLNTKVHKLKALSNYLPYSHAPQTQGIICPVPFTNDANPNAIKVAWLGAQDLNSHRRNMKLSSSCAGVRSEPSTTQTGFISASPVPFCSEGQRKTKQGVSSPSPGYCERFHSTFPALKRQRLHEEFSGAFFSERLNASWSDLCYSLNSTHVHRLLSLRSSTGEE